MTPVPRFQRADPRTLDPQQREVFNKIAAARAGVVPDPFHVLLESPPLAALTQALGVHCRYRTSLAPHLRQLAVLVAAAYWQAEYEFAVHVPEALKAGVPESVVAAVQARRTPTFADRESSLIYEFTSKFFETHDVPDYLFDEAVQTFGRRTVVELAGVLGYYSLLAIVLQIFRVPAPTKAE